MPGECLYNLRSKNHGDAIVKDEYDEYRESLLDRGCSIWWIIGGLLCAIFWLVLLWLI